MVRFARFECGRLGWYFFVRPFFFWFTKGGPAPDTVLDFLLEREKVSEYVKFRWSVRITLSGMPRLQVIEKFCRHIRERPRLTRTRSVLIFVAVLSIYADNIMCFLNCCIHSTSAFLSSTAVKQSYNMYIFMDGNIT